MTSRKRVPIRLTGSDEQYFRTREIQARPEGTPEPEPIAEARPEAPPPVPAARPDLTPDPRMQAKQPKPRISTAGQGPTRKPAVSAFPSRAPRPDPEAEGEGEVISRIVPLGRTLSQRLQAVAAGAGVPVEDLLYAARKKAVTRLRAVLAGATKPEVPEAVKGGETIRISFKLTPEELGRLTQWFDPLGLGIATRPVAPLLAAALRAEVTAICKAG